jgi:SagB-type dehydrogenase family enzyme
LSTYPEIGSSCAALVLVAAIFGRTRFKYGLRGYRFALLEAGHVAQNVLLAATALGLAAVPLGAFYDRRTDTFLALDGVNESTLYAIAVGREPT